MAAFYDPFMRSLEKVLIHHRRQLLQQTKGVVLEVGAGTGVNFPLYPKNVQVFAIEPSVPMYKRAVKVAKNYPNIKVYNMGIEEVLQHNELPSQFDYITSMLVLCTIPNPELAAGIYYKLLKDDGKLLVLEHIHSEGKIYGKLQKLVNPVWRPFADGCNLTRRQDFILKNSGFKALTESYFSLGTDWYEAVMIKNTQDDTL
jgi:SAM-dependent methyltransferase